MAIATGTAIALAAAASAAASTATGIYSAHKQSDAATTAAKLTTDATTHAADLQDAATKRAQAFTQQQAENDWRNTEATRLANYNLQKARVAGAQSLGDTIGFHLPGLPDYVPTTDPHFDTGQTDLPSAQTTPGSTTTTPGGLPSIDPSKGDLAGQISAYFKSRGVSDQETPYWVGKWSELTARGQQLGDPTYASKRLSQADIFGGNRGTTPAPPSTAGTLGQTVGSPMLAPQGGPAPTLAQNPFFQPGTLGFAIGRR